MHVSYLDVLDRADAGADRERRARIVGVDVHLQRVFVPDHEQGISEPLELRLERVGLEITLDHEGRAVAKARELLVRRLDGRSLDRRRLRQRLTADDRCDPAQELDKPCGAGVHDARLAQDVELLLRARDCLLTPRHQELEQLGNRPRSLCLRGLGEHADRGQHRPLHRFPYGPIRGVRAGAQRPCGGGAVDRGLPRKRVREPADDLREDDARVPTSPHQRRARHLLRQLRPIGGGR